MVTDMRIVFRENLRSLMRWKEIPNPYQLALYLKGKGVPVSQRTIAYSLDDTDDRYANLSTIEAVAAGFSVQPWQLLVPNFDPEHPPALATAAKPAETNTAPVTTARRGKVTAGG